MPERRKSKEELANEALPTPDSDDGSDEAPSSAGVSEALTEDDRAEVNELFTLLNRNSFETMGDYTVRYNAQIDRKVVTFTAVLPSSNDWDPSQAFDSGGPDE